jgi:hypothetical protein
MDVEHNACMLGRAGWPARLRGALVHTHTEQYPQIAVSLKKTKTRRQCRAEPDSCAARMVRASGLITRRARICRGGGGRRRGCAARHWPTSSAYCVNSVALFEALIKSFDGGDAHLDQAHHRYGRRAVVAFDRRLLRRGRLMGTDGGAWVCDYAGRAVDRGRAALPPGPLACQRGGGDYAAEKVTTL